MVIHALVQDEFMEKKTISSFIYLIECGREIELTYKGQLIFISKHGSKKYCSMCIGEEEQPFESVEDLLTNGEILGKKLYEIWNEVTITSLF